MARSRPAVHTQKLAEAEALKQEGNQLYAKGDIEAAVVSSLLIHTTAPLCIGFCGTKEVVS